MENHSNSKLSWIVAATSTAISLTVAVGIFVGIQAYRAQNNVPTDLKIVALSKAVPPFYSNIFRSQEIASTDFLINDPITLIRPKPFFPELLGLGPHDVLGFRNRAVPLVADVVTIGDSQTYGNNVVLSENWPSQLEQSLSEKGASVYNIAVGGWSMPQYLELLKKSLVFQPRVIIIAIYTGNDALETFKSVYALEYYQPLRNSEFSIDDLPPAKFPPSSADLWSVKISSQYSTTFTAPLRLASNDREIPSVREGYDLIVKMLDEVGNIARQVQIKTVVTIIPSKELVYEKALKTGKTKLRPDYKRLLQQERNNISKIQDKIREQPELTYVDLLEVLQTEVLSRPNLYPQNENGHPNRNGYRFIADKLGGSVNQYLPPPLSNGPLQVKLGNDQGSYFLLKNGKLYQFESEEVLISAGWRLEQFKEMSPRDQKAYTIAGVIRDGDQAKFGANTFYN